MASPTDSTPSTETSPSPPSDLITTTTEPVSAEAYCEHVYNISNATTIAELVFANASRDEFVSACLQEVNTSHGMSVFLSIPYAIIFLLSVVGNGLVILTLVRHKKMRTITNMYLLNLAVSDLLLAVFCMPFTLVPMMMQAFVFGSVICVLIRYLQAVSVAVSCFTLVVISIERFYAICQPLRSRRWQTLKHSYKVLLAIWMTSLLLMVPIAVFTKVIVVRNGVPACREIWPSYVLDALFAVLLDMVLFAVPLLLMAMSYGKVARELWASDILHHMAAPLPSENGGEQFRYRGDDRELEIPSNPMLTNSPMIPRRMHGNQQGDGFHGKLLHSGNTHDHVSNACAAMQALRPAHFHRILANKRRVIKMLFVVVLEYFVCWAPLYVLNTWAVLDYRSLQFHVTPTHRATIFLLAYLSSCVHPITYCFMNNRFRQSFADAFRDCLPHGSRYQMSSEGSQGVKLMPVTPTPIRTNGTPC